MSFYDLAGYDLPTHIWPGDYERIVACLNVWNDRAELEANVPTWLGAVDHIVAVDGAYAGVPGATTPKSTDGTLDLLGELGAEIVPCDRFWPDQMQKRTEYWRRCRPGDLVWVIDADESYGHADTVRNAPHLDVGWIRYTSPIYFRPQWIPRLFRYAEGMEYRTRHHWLFNERGLVATNQRGGSGLIHRQVPIHFHNSRGQNRPDFRKLQAGFHRQLQHQNERKAASDPSTGFEPLRILQLGPFDPGAVMYRLHTGLNTTSPHTSVMSTAHQEFFRSPHQFDHGLEGGDWPFIAYLKPDIAHYHVQYNGAPRIGSRWTAIHHHGTVYRTDVKGCNALDAERADVRFVSNLELLQYAEDLVWLPNPVPVGDYRKLAENRPPWKRGQLIVAHSPTKQENKATSVFLRAVDRCRNMGLDVRANIAHRASHAATLELKAKSHTVFDSFWLGLQCSGLEGAAMGLPVIAGDTDVRDEYMKRRGRQPYTFANDEHALVDALERLATDEEYYHQEAAEVGSYTLAVHDTANVVAQYLEILDEHLNWRENLPMGTP